MSLTRVEWEDMWDQIKKLERLTEDNISDSKPRTRAAARFCVQTIKDYIQQVIGQME